MKFSLPLALIGLTIASVSAAPVVNPLAALGKTVTDTLGAVGNALTGGSSDGGDAPGGNNVDSNYYWNKGWRRHSEVARKEPAKGIYVGAPW